MATDTDSIVQYATGIQEILKPGALPPWLSAEQGEVLDGLFKAYRAHRGSVRHKLTTIAGDERVLLNFFSHAQGVVGQVQPHDFERWANHLYLERHVAAATQRGYQTAVRVFFDYVLREPRLRNLVRQQLGSEPEQVATPENSIVHRRERELERGNPRRSFTQDEAMAFLVEIDRSIVLAHNQHSKSLRAYQRDKAMFCVVLEMGLRADECLGLNDNSFEPNPLHPSMGAFGLARVFGKGSKWRQVPALKAEVSAVLQWYTEHIRPQYLAGARSGERALFLSERGTRLTYPSFHREFTRIRENAGLPRELVPHSLRHTSVSSDDIGGLSLEANRQRHGHVYGSTTQGYTHYPDAYVKGEFGRAINRNIQDKAAAHGL
jgi:site-specific recombinase XerD